MIVVAIILAVLMVAFVVCASAITVSGVGADLVGSVLDALNELSR